MSYFTKDNAPALGQRGGRATKPDRASLRKTGLYVKLSADELAELDEAARAYGLSRADTILQGIRTMRVIKPFA